MHRTTPRCLPVLLLTPIFILASGCGHEPIRDNPAALGERAAQHAQAMLGKPYRYGGNTPRGFDCSGLVQYSYARAGMKLPRSTAELRNNSRPISRRQLQRGDLLFFNQEGKASSHVAMSLGGDRFIHSPSTGKNVYIASLAEPYWHKHFAQARRLDID